MSRIILQACILASYAHNFEIVPAIKVRVIRGDIVAYPQKPTIRVHADVTATSCARDLNFINPYFVYAAHALSSLCIVYAQTRLHDISLAGR